MSDEKFGAWTAPESPVTIEYSLVVIEEIRHDVAEGFQRLSRGGIEVGGVLYGTHDGDNIRILAMRPIACEHARGPGFALSDKDRAALHEQLVRDKDDPRLEGLVAVGWFLSHTRSEITLNQSDLEIYSIFFPESWQVAMVVRPGRGTSMRAGFFVRESGGDVQADRSHLEFNFPDRLAGVLDRPPERASDRGSARLTSERLDRRIPSLYRAEAAAVPAPLRRDMPAFDLDKVPQFLPQEQPKRKWIWFAVWPVLTIGLIVVGLRYWMSSNASEPLSLAVLERDGALEIQWDRSAKPVSNAARGSLQIVDGADARTIALTPQSLASGKFSYQRKSGDVEVRLTVENASGEKMQEASRFLGRAPGAPAENNSAELAELQKRRTELEAEVDRLRRENDTQAAKIQQLERTLRVLETRLGIDKE